MTKEPYKELTSEDIEHYGRRIVPSSIALAILEKRAKRKLERSTLIQKVRSGKLRPLGIYKHTLYFWRSDIEIVRLYERKPKPEEKKKSKII